jgi:hypothetical protein
MRQPDASRCRLSAPILLCGQIEPGLGYFLEGVVILDDEVGREFQEPMQMGP